MKTRNIIIIVVAIIAIIAIAGAIYYSIESSNNDKNVVVRESTPFNNSFMDGAFTGKKVKLANNSSSYMQSYKDKEHNITYNISTVDNSSALMDIYYLQGIMNPERRSFNGNDWNIYFSQAYEGNNTNETITVVICQSQKEKQGYLIYMIVGSKSDVNTSLLNIYGEVYTDYVEPLLESIHLKETKNVTTVYDEFNLTKDEFQKQMDLIHQYKAGNTSALDQGAQNNTQQEAQQEEQ